MLALFRCSRVAVIGLVVLHVFAGFTVPVLAAMTTAFAVMLATHTGFGELFRIMSYEEIGAATILSRATSGRIGNKFVVCCPGSSGAVRLALSEILIPELAHILREMNR